MDEILGALLQILGELLVELAFELAIEAAGSTIRRRRNLILSQPDVVGALVLAGTGAGLLSTFLFPHRLVTTGTVLPGASLILAPIGTGIIMHFTGRHLIRLGRLPSPLATFRGGALLALSMSVVRWWLVGH